MARAAAVTCRRSGRDDNPCRIGRRPGAERARHPTHASPVRHTHDVRILVADDEEAVRTAVRRALTLAGYEVELASDGDDAPNSRYTP